MRVNVLHIMRKFVPFPGQVYAKVLELKQKKKKNTVKNTIRARIEHTNFDFITCSIKLKCLKFPKFKHKNY